MSKSYKNFVAECPPQYETVFFKKHNNTHPAPDVCSFYGESDWATATGLCQRTSFVWATGAPLVSFYPLCQFYSSQEAIDKF